MTSHDTPISRVVTASVHFLFQLVLNGNNVAWSTVTFLVKKLDKLDELHLSANNLQNPGNSVLEVRHSIVHSLSASWRANKQNKYVNISLFQNKNLKQLFLSCNPISDFSRVTLSLLSQCPG